LILGWTLDTAVASHVQRRCKRGNKNNTGEGDDPDTGEAAGLYNDPELEMELACYVQQGMEVADELALNEVIMNKDLETTRAVLDQAMGNVVLGNKSRKRPETCLHESESVIDLDSSHAEITGSSSGSVRARRQQLAAASIRDVGKTIARRVDIEEEKVQLAKDRLALDAAKLELERERLVEERKAAARMELMLQFLMERK
jgi:hypothetical protein